MNLFVDFDKWTNVLLVSIVKDDKNSYYLIINFREILIVIVLKVLLSETNLHNIKWFYATS